MKSIIAPLFAIYALGAPPANLPPSWIVSTLPSLSNPSFETVMEYNLPDTDASRCSTQTFRFTHNEIGSCAALTLNLTYENSMAEHVDFSCFHSKMITIGTTSNVHISTYFQTSLSYTILIQTLIAMNMTIKYNIHIYLLLLYVTATSIYRVYSMHHILRIKFVFIYSIFNYHNFTFNNYSYTT